MKNPLRLALALAALLLIAACAHHPRLHPEPVTDPSTGQTFTNPADGQPLSENVR